MYIHLYNIYIYIYIYSYMQKEEEETKQGHIKPTKKEGLLPLRAKRKAYSQSST